MFLEKQYIYRISNRLDSFKELNNNIYNSKCPICGDSKSNKNKMRFYIFYFKNKFIVKCHNCGYSNSFEYFLKDFDFNLFEDFKFEKFKSYKNNIIKEEIDLKTNIKLESNIIIDSNNILKNILNLNQTTDSNILKYIRYRKIPNQFYEYLYSTDDINLITSQLEKYKELNYQKSLSLVIPFFNRNKEISMIQTRYINNNIKPRFQTFSIIEDENFVYNEHLLDYNKMVSILEGPIDSLFVYNGTSTAGSTNKNRINYVSSLTKDFRIILDNDYNSNKHILKQLKLYISENFNVVIYDQKFNGIKDLNDAIISNRFTIETLNEYLDSRTFKGLKADLELGKQLGRK